MHILVKGSAGYIGSVAVLQLTEKELIFENIK
jgi:UDP-glucose 4-epimerase